jgi:ABC-type polysaccharide/polyol phosphate transport system ATPase subunit
MDEGILAGDARFLERAELLLSEFVGRSSIVVLASHASSLIKSICNKAALLSAGRLLAVGPVGEMLERYDAMVHAPAAAAAEAPAV